MKRYKLLEILTLPYLFIKVMIENLKGKKKFLIEKHYFGKEKNQYIMYISPKTGIHSDKIIFFTYGGGWKRGNAYIFRYIGYFFAKYGYTTVMTGYRLVPRSKYPCQVEDTIASINKGIRVAREKGQMTDRIILAGQSAGGHLVSIIAYNQQYKTQIQASIKGVISISGVINFSQCKIKDTIKLIDNFVGNEDNRREADPFNYVSEDSEIPILCIHGEHDPIVDLTGSIDFVDFINSFGNSLGELKVVKRGLHANLTSLFWNRFDYQYMLDWIQKR